MTSGSAGWHENRTLGCADRAGRPGSAGSGQNDSGIGQNPPAKAF